MHHRWMGGRSIQAVAGAHGSFLGLFLFFRVTPPVRLGRPAPLSNRAACDVWRLLLPADELQGFGKGVSMAVVVRKPVAVGATTATNTAAAAAATAAATAAAAVGLGRARGHPSPRPLLLPLLLGRHHLPPDCCPSGSGQSPKPSPQGEDAKVWQPDAPSGEGPREGRRGADDCVMDRCCRCCRSAGATSTSAPWTTRAGRRNGSTGPKGATVRDDSDDDADMPRRSSL